jgi:hypothetical protein
VRVGVHLASEVLGQSKALHRGATAGQAGVEVAEELKRHVVLHNPEIADEARIGVLPEGPLRSGRHNPIKSGLVPGQRRLQPVGAGLVSPGDEALEAEADDLEQSLPIASCSGGVLGLAQNLARPGSAEVNSGSVDAGGNGPGRRAEEQVEQDGAFQDGSLWTWFRTAEGEGSCERKRRE